VLEALEAGVPVVVSPQVQLADFVRGEGLGMVVESMSRELSQAIVGMIGEEGEPLRTRARERGAEIVARTFSPQIVGDLLSTMYRRASERSRVRGSTGR